MATTKKCILLVLFTVLVVYLAAGDYLTITRLATLGHFLVSSTAGHWSQARKVDKSSDALIPKASNEEKVPSLQTTRLASVPNVSVRNNGTLPWTTPFQTTRTLRPDTNGTRPSPIFQPIDDQEAWVYSAFYDHVSAKGGRPLVRIFGLAHEKLMNKIVCYFSEKDKHYNSSGQVTRFYDWHDAKYPPAYINCNIPKDARPTHVSVTFNSSTQATNRLLIQYSGPRTRNFTVCYAVLHNNYSLSSLLIEAIELNRILGAEHFYVYNFSISPSIDKILRHYQQEGVVTVMPWPLPTLKSWYYAQTTSINDCIYRNRNVSRFVVVVDTDEFFIPRNQLTWMELIHAFSPEEKDVKAFVNATSVKKADKITACFGARSSYFVLNAQTNWTSLPSQYTFTEVEKTNLLRYHVQTLTQYWRRKLVFPVRVRTKYIARPELVYEGGIHFVMTFTDKGGKCVYFGEHQTLVHHYRVWAVDNTSVVDTNILKFKAELYPRLMERFSSLF